MECGKWLEISKKETQVQLVPTLRNKLTQIKGRPVMDTRGPWGQTQV